MRFKLSAFALALGLLAAPGESRAFWNMPQSSAGYGWWQARALNCCPSIHFHGPLYNYGPYYPGGVGYQDMFVQNPWCGGYVPAWPSVYQNTEMPRQWSSINPALINSPYPGFAPPTAPGHAPADYFQGNAAPVPQGPVATNVPYGPVVQAPQAPAASNVVEPSAPTATTTSFRPFRGRFQR